MAPAKNAAVGRNNPHDLVYILAIDKFTRKTGFPQLFVGNQNIDIELSFKAPGDRLERLGLKIKFVLAPRKHMFDIHPAQRQQPERFLKKRLLPGRSRTHRDPGPPSTSRLPVASVI